MAIGVFLFFGSKDTKSAETIESFTRKFHVPYVCPCLTKVVDAKNNFQIHMKPPFTMAIVDMIRHYRWRNIIYLYDSTEGKYRELMRFFFWNLRCLLDLLCKISIICESCTDFPVNDTEIKQIQFGVEAI